MHLPVRRPRDKDRSAVLALRTELDQWIAARPTHDKPVILPSDPTTAKKILKSRLEHLKTEVRLVKKQIRELELRDQQNGSPQSEKDEAVKTAYWEARNKKIVDEPNLAIERTRTAIRNTNILIDHFKTRVRMPGSETSN